MKYTGKRIVAILLLVVLTLGAVKCASDAREAKREMEAIATAQGFAKVLSETLSDKSSLIVQEAAGVLLITAVNHGTVFDTWQKSKVPYSVVYTVDQSRISAATTRYDASSKTLFVQIPEVSVQPPNIDETRKVITGRGGYWTSRQASENLAARASKLATAGAAESANKPDKVRAAQEKARTKVEQLFEVPLRASGQRDVNVVVRLSTDASQAGERWDVSPSIEQILAHADGKK